jgi:iron complex transport system permease protein
MSQSRATRLIWSAVGATLFLMALGVCVGSTGLESLGTNPSHPILWDIRLPRTLGAWAAGALLGLSGAVAQGLFRNPLADPYLLGSASGAALGVAIVLAGSAAVGWGGETLGSLAGAHVFDGSLGLRLGITGAAFAGAVLAVMLTVLLSRGVESTVRLLLAGVVVGVVLAALTQLVLLAAPESLQPMQSFMLGSTAYVGWVSCTLMLVVWGACQLAAWLLARVLDGLSLGEATARSLGLPVAPLRAALVVVLALATGTAVAHTGLIAFVGLAAPHWVRSLTKGPHAPLILLSSLTGGLLLMAADILARSVIAPQELPVGVLTAVLGGGYLLWRLHRGNVMAGGGP